MAEDNESIAAAPTKDCRSCGLQIPRVAIKCSHCGAHQNFQRYFDIGQGTIALLIALISVSTLAVESSVRAYNSAFGDPLVPNIYGKVLSAELDEVELLFINNGTSRVFILGGGLCRMPLVREGVDLIDDSPDMLRFPKRAEVEAIYAISYSDEGKDQFLEPGASLRLKVKRHGVMREEGLPLLENVVEVKGYCSVSWIGQDAQENGVFWNVSTLDTYRVSAALAKFPFEKTINFKAGEEKPD